jgi:hypothetical protein
MRVTGSNALFANIQTPGSYVATRSFAQAFNVQTAERDCGQHNLDKRRKKIRAIVDFAISTSIVIIIVVVIV